MPLPIPAPRSRRGRTGWLIALAVVAVIGLCGFVDTFALPGLLGLLPGSLSGWELEGQAWWAGEGDYLVAQMAEEDGRPLVVVWERASGEVSKRSGVRAVAVEPHAPVVWLAADRGGPSRAAFGMDWTPPDVAGDDLDGRPERLDRWDLATGKSARVTDVSAWTSWPGPAGMTACLDVDPKAGALPSRLTFRPSSGEGTAVVADLPDDAVTIEPVGWSPSGEFFAAVTLATLADTGEAHETESSQTGLSRRVMFSARSGEVVAEQRDEGSPYGSLGLHAVWDAERDMLYWVDAEESTEDQASDVPFWASETPTERYFVAYLTPEGRQGEASSLTGWRDPEALADAWGVDLAGRAADGVLLDIGSNGPPELWTAGATARHVRGLEGERFDRSSAVCSPAGHVACVEYRDGGPELMAGKLGSKVRRIWRGEP